ncbi:hypothetical protein Pcinc_030488 [Petrolisthes cinctipes]|uniref:Uncharacterized protein n=1 Tax=Petrolisthes cinctipes TaxID=88211 RepID=A0AAE1K2G5_PETCI|nr:hypothetical protein Pcinc_030488 [Petrolisthes cinctipes]
MTCSRWHHPVLPFDIARREVVKLHEVVPDVLGVLSCTGIYEVVQSSQLRVSPSFAWSYFMGHGILKVCFRQAVSRRTDTQNVVQAACSKNSSFNYPGMQRHGSQQAPKSEIKVRIG